MRVPVSSRAACCWRPGGTRSGQPRRRNGGRWGGWWVAKNCRVAQCTKSPAPAAADEVGRRGAHQRRRNLRFRKLLRYVFAPRPYADRAAPPDHAAAAVPRCSSLGRRLAGSSVGSSDAAWRDGHRWLDIASRLAAIAAKATAVTRGRNIRRPRLSD